MISFICGIKKKYVSKQNRNKLIDTEHRLTVARGEGAGGLGEKGEGIEKCRLIITKQSLGQEVPHKEQSPQYYNNYVWGQMCPRLTREVTL